MRIANLKAVRAGEGLKREWGPKLQGWMSDVNAAIAAQQVCAFGWGAGVVWVCTHLSGLYV